jgi:hypothetical protein
MLGSPLPPRANPQLFRVYCVCMCVCIYIDWVSTVRRPVICRPAASPVYPYPFYAPPPPPPPPHTQTPLNCRDARSSLPETTRLRSRSRFPLSGWETRSSCPCHGPRLRIPPCRSRRRTTSSHPDLVIALAVDDFHGRSGKPRVGPRHTGLLSSAHCRHEQCTSGPGGDPCQ